MRLVMIAAAAALIAGCSEDAPVNNSGSEQVPAALNPGMYEVTTVVESLQSTDQTTPATKAQANGQPVTHRACVTPEGTVEPSMFSEAGDECRIDNAYARNGRLTLSLSCSRPDTPGTVAQSVEGRFTSDGFDATVETATYLTGAGDYRMRRKMTGKRVGECTAEEDEPA